MFHFQGDCPAEKRLIVLLLLLPIEQSVHAAKADVYIVIGKLYLLRPYEFDLHPIIDPA